MPRKAKQYQAFSQHKPCQWPGCVESAAYPAPKARRLSDENPGSRELFYFCLSHVREYNLGWDFFKGMNQKDIEKFQKEAVTGHRPTRKIREYKFLAGEIFSGLHEVFEGDIYSKPEAKKHLPLEERQALEVLELEYPVSQQEIKLKYKSLVKIYHPDLNGGNKQAEEKFKVVTSAYKYLISSEFININE